MTSRGHDPLTNDQPVNAATSPEIFQIVPKRHRGRRTTGFEWCPLTWCVSTTIAPETPDRVAGKEVALAGSSTISRGRTHMRRLVIGLVASVSFVAVLGGLAGAQDKRPDASLTLSEGSVA